MVVSPAMATPLTYERLGLRAHLLSRQDSRSRAVFSARSRCMRQTGSSYPDPMTANNDLAFATEEATGTEVRTPVADVRCKRTVGVVEVWTAVEAAYQRQAIDAHHDQLELIRQAIQARLANARAVLAARPPP
jgi:hypothetical protein